MSENQKGFSLIELLMVVTIIGIVAAIGIPNLTKAIGATRNSNAVASLKIVTSSQVAFYATNNRFGRLDELNSSVNNSLGTTVGNTINRGFFTLTMSPATPTDEELKSDYEVIATKAATTDNTPCVLSLKSSGLITEIFGTSCITEN